MKKSLRILFTMLLALVGMSSWAQFDAEKTYTLRASGSSAYLTTTEVSSTGNAGKTFAFAAEPEQFRIVESANGTSTGYTIQSATTDKYIGVNQWNAVDAEYVWGITAVNAAENTYKINLQGQANKGLGWDNAAAGQGVFTDKSGNSWIIEEYVEGMQVLTLSYAFNEGKTQATVTVEGLTGNGDAYWFFAGDDEPQGMVEDGTFMVAPQSFPAEVSVVVREYDDTFETVYAEGFLTIIFPGVLDVDASKYYTLRTERGYLPNHENLTTKDGIDGQWLFATTDAEEAGIFKIAGELDACTIYNVQLKKYLSANGGDAYTDEANGTFTIVNAMEHNGLGNAWIIKSNETGNWLMFGGSAQYLNNDGWKAADAGDQWYIEETEYTEPAAPVAELTLSYMLNEAKTLATVTVEEGLVEAEGSMVIYFLNDDEETAQMLEGSNQFTVAPTNAPEIVKVTVRQYDAEMENVLAEGEININFPEVVTAELIYTVSATYSALTFDEDGEEVTLAPYVEGNAQVDVYEGFAVIHNALGMDGAELKVAYSEYDEQMEYNHITSLELTGAAGQFIYDDEEGYYIYTDEAAGQAMVVSPQWAVINEQKGNITMLVQDFVNESLTAYYLVWGEEGEQPGENEPIATLNGTVLDRPNAYICDMLGLEEDDVIISMSDPARNVRVDVYEEYFIIRNFMNAEGVDLQCWYQVDDSDEENPQTMIYKYQIVGQEFGEDEIPGNVSGSYIVVNMEGYDLAKGMCNLNPMGGWLTILANKLSDMENYYHYSLDFSPAVEVEKPTVDPVEGEYDELQTITITFDQAVTIPVEDWENGVYFVPQPYIEGENTYAWESAALVAGENEGEVIFTLENPIVRGDVYTFTLPEGCVEFADGTKNPEFTYTYTITGNNFHVTTEEGETSMTITPASGETVSVLEKFDVLLTGFINIPAWEVEATLYDAEGEEVCYASFNDNYDGTYSIELWKKVTKAGTYTLKFTVPNQNEAWDEIGRHNYEATYTVDGSEYVEMPYTVDATTAKMPDEENYDDMEPEVAFGQDVTVVIDEDNFVIKNFLGIEGFDLTAYYQMWGTWCYVSSLSAPGVDEPSMMIQVTPNDEIGTIGIAMADAQLDPKSGKICVQIMRGDGEDMTYTYVLLAWGEELLATGINSVSAVKSDAIYNLNGQAVKNAKSGLYIINGKKVVIK